MFSCFKGFLQFFESFRGKIYKKYSIGNEEWVKVKTATIITIDYVVQSLEHFISSVPDKTIVHTPKKLTVLSFFFNSKDTEIFPKLLF